MCASPAHFLARTPRQAKVFFGKPHVVCHRRTEPWLRTTMLAGVGVLFGACGLFSGGRERRRHAEPCSDGHGTWAAVVHPRHLIEHLPQRKREREARPISRPDL